MKRISILSAGACAAVMGFGAYAAVPAPLAVPTQSGPGAVMTAGQRPNLTAETAMISGGGMHTLDLRVETNQRLQIGASVPLITPGVEKVDTSAADPVRRDF